MTLKVWRDFMVNYYMLAILFVLMGYIILFDIFIKQEKWLTSSKKKFRNIYILTWATLYLIYLFVLF